MKLSLDNIRSVDFDLYLRECLLREDVYHIGLVTSGYEKRSTYWIRELENAGLFACISEWLVLGFEEKKDQLSRTDNDAFYVSRNLPIMLIEEHSKEFASSIAQFITDAKEKSKGRPLCIHVDYSCMPRSWYCEVPRFLQRSLRRNELFSMWYSSGIYPVQEYPTAGVNDFRIFSGQPSLGANYRTHLFGLGFDKIRSQAIWSVLDPQNLVCFFADNSASPEYQKKVCNDNADVITASMFTFTAPLNDFASALSRIRSVVVDLVDNGDVIIIPDGPKPLILASSIIPLSINRAGIVCFHVRRRRDADIRIVDVDGGGKPSGFILYGTNE